MNWLSRQTLSLLSGCVLASANYGCSREPEPGLDLGEIEAASKPSLDPVEIEAASRSFRQIVTKNRVEIDKRTSSTRVIRSQKILDAFFSAESMERKTTPKQQAFYSALRAETIDFPRELLCLYCLYHSSESITSRLGPTTLTNSNRHMTFRLSTISPKGFQVAAGGVDCFPVIIDSSAVDTLSWEVDGVEVYSADLTQPPLPFDTQRLRYSDAVKRVKNKR